MGKWQKIQEAITASSNNLNSHRGNVHNALGNAPKENPIWSKLGHNDLPYSFDAKLGDLHKHLGLKPEHVLDYTKKYNAASEKDGGVDGRFSVYKRKDGNHEISFDHGG